MNCEICGTEIKGQPYKVKIDNSVMLTCKECSKYGKVQKKPQQTNNNRKGKNNTRKSNRTQNKTYTRQPKEVEFELVEDYPNIIRKAREKNKLTQKQFGEKIYERESVVAHIETGKMVPNTKLARKIEKILKIKIVEKVESDEDTFQDSKNFKEATIGDIARIRRN